VGASGGNTDAHSGVRLPYKPSFDAERGLVSFERCMVRRSGGKAEAPELYVYTGFNLRSVVGRMPACYERGGFKEGLVNMGCPPEVLKHPELVAIYGAIRRDADFSLKAVDDNLDELHPAADAYLQAADAKYQVGAAVDRTYAGIVPLEPDGAIQQVSWSVGGGRPATTRASRNCEHAVWLPSLPEKRKSEDLRRFMTRLAKVEAPVPPVADAASQNKRPEGAY
jgi:hypothetical protein